MLYKKEVYNSMIDVKDKFYSLCRNGICDIHKISDENREYEIIVSYDMINVFMSIINSNFLDLASKITIKIIDERMEYNYLDFLEIGNFMKMLNKTLDKKIKSLSLELSYDMVGVYSYNINSE